MTNSIEEFEKSDLILITGSNTSEMHPVLSSFMKRGIRNGKTKLIVVDPRDIKMVDHADIWLRQKPGSDVAWLNGMIHVIINEELYDKKYVAERTENFEELKKITATYTPERVEAISGIPKDRLVEAARMYAEAPAASIAYAMGITQHINGTDAVKSVANLAMLCGNVGIEAGGVNPLRGQNNVQGACDMGGLPNVFSGYQPVDSLDASKKMAQAWGVSTLPDKKGLTIVEIVNAASHGDMKGLYIMGENPMLSDPDLNHVEEGFGKLDFLVVQDIFLTETAQKADVVLPAASFAEKDGTFTNTERRVQRVRKAVEPPGSARDDWEIICGISDKMGVPMPYASVSDIFDELASVTPSYAGITYDRIEVEGIQWPCPDQNHPGTRFLHKDKFVRGKGMFHGIEWTPPAESPDKDYPYLLTTGRVLYHYHTGTMTHRSGGFDELYGECLAEVNDVDAEKLKIKDGDMIRVASRRGEIQVKASVSGATDQGVIFIPFHFSDPAVNKLINSSDLDPIAKIPEYKVCPVSMEKVA